MSAQAVVDEATIRLQALGRDRLEEMAAAGREILECYRVLVKGGTNLVAEVLKGQGTFYEWDHYPEGDAFDAETYSQYYYHAHRSSTGEHGHFHIFLRAGAFPADMKPLENDGDTEWPMGDEALTHLVAISMDKYGFPTNFFTTNRWVTGETWYGAEDVIGILDRFNMDHCYPSWPVNRWMTAMIRLFRPQIEELIRERDRAVAEWQGDEGRGLASVLEDRNLEITSIADIDVDRQIAAVDRALAAL